MVINISARKKAFLIGLFGGITLISLYFGILGSSIVGITFMLNTMQEIGQIPSKINFNLNMKIIRKITIIFAIIIFLLSFI